MYILEVQDVLVYHLLDMDILPQRFILRALRYSNALPILFNYYILHL